MKTLTINNAGKRATAYILENFNRSTRKNISVKSAKEMIKNIPVFDKGNLYATYKLPN